MINFIKQKLELSIYGYEPGVFLPVFYDGQLINRKQFVMYKFKRACGKLRYVVVVTSVNSR